MPLLIATLPSPTPALLGLFFGLPSWAELGILACVGLLLFGKRLPDVARSVGQSIVEFKRGMAGVKDEINNAANAMPKSDPKPPLPPNTTQPHAQSDTPSETAAAKNSAASE
jgi:sec-independent protein translocase protein TatA